MICIGELFILDGVKYRYSFVLMFSLVSFSAFFTFLIAGRITFLFTGGFGFRGLLKDDVSFAYAVGVMYEPRPRLSFA